MATEENEYCLRLNVPVPRVEDLVASRNAKLFHLLVVALLEHGRPLTLEAVAQRLAAAGVDASTGNLVYSLQKAWHGLQPVFRDPDGRFGLNLQSIELNILLFQLGLRPTNLEPTPLPPEPEVVPDDVPLTEVEIRAAYCHPSISYVSTLRQSAAVLDSRGEAMSVTAVQECLSQLTGHRLQLSPTDVRRWSKTCVRISPDGRLQLDRTMPEVLAMRRAIRKLACQELTRQAQAHIWEQLAQQRKAAEAQRQEQDRRVAQGLRRAVLRLVPAGQSPVVAALLDVGAHVIRSFVGPEIPELRAALEKFDLIAALGPREALHTMHIRDVDRWRLVDLKPPKKTRRLNRQGRTLSITPELLIAGTTGISRPLAATARLLEYLDSGATGKLRRRIESDAKSLLAFYNYGVLHNGVRLRWGFLDEMLPVDWSVPGDPSLYALIKDCQTSGAPVDIVCGSAPGWTDPWSRAQRVSVVSFEPWSVMVESDGLRWVVPRYEIQAIRPATRSADE
jgi:DNA-binding transcriptional regulator YdaS (Cro superfamily)